MNWRCLISLLASSALFGCAGDKLVLTDTTRSLALNWDRSEWRFCKTAECATPTPKTVLLVSPPSVVEPVALTSRKPVPTVKRTRTISVPFKFASAAVTSEAEKILHKEVAHSFAGDSILVEGRTDDLGSQTFNDRLARKRAEAVVATINRLGVKGEIEIHSQGKCCYATTNLSEKSRAKNRRVDLQISTTQKE
jgi:outer membrane protein OmpA-like peptidoglycan-associated protein